MKILIIDDEPILITYLRYILQEAGHQTISVLDGRKALEHLEKQTVDLILSDVQMPELDGFQLCRILKSQSATRAIPVILISATFQDEEDRHLAQLLGAAAYLKKPFTPAELLETIHMSLSNSSRGPSPDMEFADAFSLYNKRVINKLDQKIRDLHEEIEKRIITERMLAQQETFLQFILQTTVDGIITSEPNGKIIYVNQACACIFKYPLRTINRLNIQQLIPDVYEETVNNKSVHGRLYGHDSDDKQLILDVVTTKQYSKKQLLYVSTIRDITAQMVRDSQIAQLAEVVRQGQESVVITDTDGNITYTNPSFERVTGYSAEEVKGKNPRILNSGRHSKKFYRKMWQRILSGKSWKGKFINKKKDGTLYHEEAAIFPIMDNQKNIINFAAIRMDITEQVQADEKIALYQAKLKSLMNKLNRNDEEERRRIAQNIHDNLSQTLAITKIKIQSLISLTENGDIRDELNICENYLSETIDKSRKITQSLSPTVLYELGFVPACQALLDKIETNQGIVCRFDEDGKAIDLPPGLCALLYRSTNEMLVNIIKHAQATEAVVSLRWRKREIVLCVADNGVGFKPDMLHAGSFDDPGFGLFSIRERISYIGGKVKLKSVKNGGTRICITIPI